MRILSLDGLTHRAVDAHGSTGFSVAALGLTAEAYLVAVHLRAGGVIGRHPAAARQLLILLSGDATVSGSETGPVDLAPGQAAVWEPYELHETRTTDGMTALIVEGEIEVGGREAPAETDWA